MFTLEIQDEHIQFVSIPHDRSPTASPSCKKTKTKERDDVDRISEQFEGVDIHDRGTLMAELYELIPGIVDLLIRRLHSFNHKGR